ncbi:MAG: hypothetical protein JNK15_17155 [Planctomycetes bacterium]|nr:hypothetical protein [Planctomycetota bacterium]
MQNPIVVHVLTMLATSKLSSRVFAGDNLVEFLNRNLTSTPHQRLQALEDAHRQGFVRIDEDMAELTTAGGAFWEGAMQPDWSRFITGRSDFGSDEIEYSAGSERALRDMVELVRMEKRLVGQTVPAPEITKLHDWPATYWKTLPIGYACRIPSRPTSCTVTVPRDMQFLMMHAQQNLRDRWLEPSNV